MINALRKQRRAPAIFAGAVLALLALATVLFLQSLKSEETRDSQREYENLTRVFDEHVERIVKITDQSIQAMRTSYEANPMRFSLSEWMSTNVVAHDVLPQIAIIDKDGLVLTTSAAVAGASPIYINDREHFQVHVGKTKDELFISKPVLGRASGKWTIQLTRMLRDASGGFNGVIVFSLDSTYFSRFYDSISIGDSAKVFLVGTTDGIIRALAAPAADGRQLGSDIGDKRLMKEILANGAGSIVRSRAGDNRTGSTIYAYRVLKDHPLAVIIGVDEKDYLAPFLQKLRILVISAVAVGLIILGMAIWLTVKMGRLQDLEVKAVMLQLAAADEKTALRVRAEEEQRYRAATEAASDAIVSWRADGKVIFANPSARRIFGMEDSDRINDVYTAFFPAEERNHVRQAISALERRSHGLGMTIETKAINRDNDEFSAEVSLNRWTSPEGDAVTMVVRDISERRRAEEEKKQLLTQAMTAQKMEAIGTMAGGIAHDFNNVLGAMQGFIWLAQQEVAPDSSTAKLLEKASQSGERAAHVVRQLLDFSRSQTEEKDEVVMDLSKTVHELADIAMASVPTMVSCTVETQDDLFIHGDSTHVHQVLLNLLINAEHAVDPSGNGHIALLAERTLIREGHFGGSVAVDSETLPLVKTHWEADGNGGKMWYGSLLPGDYVCVSVADNGCGMNADVMRRVFEPFFTTKPVGQGTGLGLSVLLGLVKTMRGGIVLSSHLGKGTMFKLYFPYISQQSESQVRESLAPSAIARPARRVLLVDDEKSLREVVARTLAAYGYEVVEAENGIDALEVMQLDRNGFDLLLTDWSMPQMSGDKLAVAARALDPDLAIILCTGRGDKIEQFAELNLTAILTKPVYGRKLIEAIDRAMNEQAAA